MYNVELLANAIVEQACKDYCNVRIKCLERANSKMTIREEERINSCIRFFNGDWFKELCPNIDGEKLMQMLDRKAKEDLKEKLERKKKSKKTSGS